ncbi:MAG: leucyl aminopeptidase family protein [Gammaproteobacteria bacterium]|nr:MAG: leucyl aminopeptidase family protein [Gammaproteobacteria bacterium]
MDNKVKIKQYSKPLASTQAPHLIIILPSALIKPQIKKPWPPIPHGEVLKKRLLMLDEHDCSRTPFITDLPNEAGTHVALGAVDEAVSSFDLLTLARKLAQAQLARNPHTVTVALAGLSNALAARVAEALVSALLAASYRLPAFKSKKDKPGRLNSIEIHGLAGKENFARTVAEAAGNNLARHLTALPPNELTPTLYRQRIAALARVHGWRMEFLDIKKLKRLKAGAFLAVAQGSSVPDAGIVHLRYTPKQAKRPPLALVGKGVCFDTGGTNLKPAKHMYGMHEDMEGSAVALGTLLALTELKVDFPVDCWLALVQNHIGPNAYKQNDVVRASNGVSIEVVHTDAEGRMILSDTLALACKQKPALLIDYATLTGACVYALGTSYSGAFTNRPDWIPIIIETGRLSGERVWPFPMDEDYDKQLESKVADIKQCSTEGEADHILAARFLNRFVDKTIPWLHVDLASGNHKGGLAHIPTDITGFGVRYTLNLLLEQNVLTRAQGWS